MVFTGGASGTVPKYILVVATVVFGTGDTLYYSTIIITNHIIYINIRTGTYVLCDILQIESNDHLHMYILQ